MKISYRDIVLACTAVVLLGIATPLVALPLATNVLGLAWFKGLKGVIVNVKGNVIPVLVFQTPDSYTVIGFIISSIFLALYIIFRESIIVKTLFRKQLTEVIAILSSYVRTGIPMVLALERTSEVVEDPMREHLYRFAKLLRLGYDPFEVFDEVFVDAPREVKVVLSALPVAVVSGGRVAEVLIQAEKFSFQLTRLEDLRKARLEGYKGILLLAVLAYITTAVVINILMAYLIKLGTASPILRSSIDLNYSFSLYYISALIISIVSSIAVSRVVYGETLYAFKYSAILIALTSIIFAIALATI
ncbi:MAG: type II secretion system F family protein [Desulfurococcaceae archaeon]|nr:type II secretion system F family protein [Desulfurococcaceae archaeon]